ncbi:MAG: hypothetical protein PF590_03020 [Candidatus Delongbacteria bacterium]|jgi:hypothetical protein|nr:hypothetical protein [Candidatus Delongbacteria bacterium]
MPQSSFFGPKIIKNEYPVIYPPLINRKTHLPVPDYRVTSRQPAGLAGGWQEAKNCSVFSEDVQTGFFGVAGEHAPEICEGFWAVGAEQLARVVVAAIYAEQPVLHYPENHSIKDNNSS